MIYLYIHVIWTVARREALLAKPVRKVLFAHLQKDAGEKGIKIVAVGGVEDHVHCLLQLMPTQNLAQVMRAIRTSAAEWVNENKFLTTILEWEEGYAAYSVSPSGLAAVVEYIGKQEEFHQTKTLDSELQVFEKFKEANV